LAEINGAASVSRSIMALSSLLEYNFRDSNLTSTVADELGYVKKYMYLQELRYQNKFKDEYDIEQELLSAPMLKLSFQPIVENSIYHGLLSRDGLGIVFIRGRRIGDTMEFTITDNGVGMSQDKAAAILRPPDEADIYRSSEAVENIALWNIDQRIKRNYGDDYGLTIRSKTGEGTSVTIRLPLQHS
jgi:two-component system sensor histidine kinase YesM